MTSLTTQHALPARFGPFYLFDLIGRGGMAEIFLSKTFTALGTERLCVIKRILPHLSVDARFCEMLVAEAKLAARLSHANVVQTYDLGQNEGQYYISMEYVAGQSLRGRLEALPTGKRLPVKTALRMMGLGNGVLRMPLCEMTPGSEAALRQELLAYGLPLKK